MAQEPSQAIPLPIPEAECRIEPMLPALEAEKLPGNDFFFVSGRTIEVRFPGIATYRIENGRSIAIRPEPGVDHETVLFYLKAAPFGLLVLQRGELPLHTSAIAPPLGGGAVLIAGVPGAGKSTTAGLLVQRGWSVVNDDISRITIENGAPTVWPGFQSLKLGNTSMSLLQMDGAGLPQTPGPKEKFYWHQDGRREPASVSALFILENPRGAFVPPRRLAAMELLEHLYRHTIRQVLVKPLGFQESHFQGLTAFAQVVPCYRIEGNQSCAPSLLVEHIESLATNRSEAPP